MHVSEITSVCMHDRERVCVREYACECEREISEKDGKAHFIDDIDQFQELFGFQI